MLTSCQLGERELDRVVVERNLSSVINKVRISRGPSRFQQLVRQNESLSSQTYEASSSAPPGLTAIWPMTATTQLYNPTAGPIPAPSQGTASGSPLHTATTGCPAQVPQSATQDPQGHVHLSTATCLQNISGEEDPWLLINSSEIDVLFCF